MAAQLNTLLRAAYEQHVCPLPPVAGAVSAVRRRVAAVLAEWSVCPDVVEDLLLVVSELATNAVIHARPPAELRLSWRWGDTGRTLRVEVTDAGPALPAGRSLAGIDPDEHGRGEAIVHALATRHGIRVHSAGITRWAELAAA
ncbi:ATP-binding protein [Streptomyces dangxiongensis]|uniref:ATP-binding protein n=1 Tax=Streptomyces dangxiongensis TaxID=1442032 RepID=A0A3G2JKJ1_9ACTN|nr:ATP-binding protein [Streptomyces dangxiongensis]AYN42976.1 ATP-binding protein [Streptomyces dangxiongensis]